MNLAPVGKLYCNSDGSECTTAYLPIPILGDDYEVQITGLGDDPVPEDFSNALHHFLALPVETTRAEIARHVFRHYQRFLGYFDNRPPFEFKIETEADIWNFINLNLIYVSRRDVDRKVYVELAGNCDWDEEHGLQIVFREGAILSRVSDQDGHLTNSDAYGLPESEDSILGPKFS